MVYSTIAVSPETLRRQGWSGLILSALQIIDAMRDATDNDATVDVDEVLDKILDNVIEAYGSSARDVYTAIFSPAFFENRITRALAGLKYDTLRDTVVRLIRVEASDTASHAIFSMRGADDRPAHDRRDLGFKVEFKSHTIRSMVLKHLEFLHHLDAAIMIKEMKDLPPSSSFAGVLYEGYAATELASGKPSSGLVSMVEKGKTTFFVPITPDTVVSPFNRVRERSYVSLTGPLPFNVPPEKSLADYFWIPMAPNSPLFDAFVIEFKDSNQKFYAIVWILQMTLSKEHGGSSEGYPLIKLIKTEVEEAMKTMSHTRQRKRRKVNNVIVKYVLVSTQGGEWTLPEKNWRSFEGDVYYQCVNYQWYVIAYHVCTITDALGEIV
jgi:hypothetical protein